MTWHASQEILNKIIFSLGDRKENELEYGVELVDKATRGIFQDDLILVGAPTGVGKTQFCTNLALHNVRKGKKIHMMALEAAHGEIENRMLYSMLADRFYKDPDRPPLGYPLNYPDWLVGRLNFVLQKYLESAQSEFESFKNLFVLYKTAKFTYKEMTAKIYEVADQTDLVIIDHVHYFDFDEDGENQALREIAKTARQVSQIVKKPIVLVAHLRKRDRFNKDLVSGIEEFHGSSDLTKIATTVITIGTGARITPSRSETFFRVCKSRIDGGLRHYVAKMIFDLKCGNYDDTNQLGVLSKDKTEFVPILGDDLPHWAKVKT